MTDYLEFETYRRSYMPLCACNTIVSCLSVGVALWLLFFIYFPGLVILSSERLIVWLSTFGFFLILICNCMIATGHGLWLRISVGLLVLCLIIVIPSVVFQVGLVIYSVSIILPVLGLLSFNSRLHRGFYKGFIAFHTLRIQAGLESYAGAKKSYGVNSKSTSGSKISKREVAMINRRRFLEEKNAAQKRRARSKVTYPIGALLMIFLIGGFGYLIYEAFERGYVLFGGRGRPVERYSREGQAGLFWYGIVLYSICIVMGFVALRVMFALFKMDNRRAC
jgi:hypothetical protein